MQKQETSQHFVVARLDRWRQPIIFTLHVLGLVNNNLVPTCMLGFARTRTNHAHMSLLRGLRDLTVFLVAPGSGTHFLSYREPHINEIKGAIFKGSTTVKKKLVNMKNTSISAKEDVDYILCSCER